MKKFYAVLNTVIILTVIFWNYYSNTGNIGGKTVGELSDEYANFFTPAGYAFAIWGVIFLGLVVLAFSQIKLAFWGGKNSDSILQIGPWLAIANIGNGAWLWFWLNEQTGMSVVIMFVILSSLLVTVVRLNMECWDAHVKVIVTVWWPICIYSGWITVAAIANVAAYLAKNNWSGGLTEIQWTVVMICVAGLVNLFMIFNRNMREFALVGSWALVAIAVRHWGEIPVLQWAAIAWAVILFVAINVHAYKNKHMNPFTRNQQPNHP